MTELAPLQPFIDRGRELLEALALLEQKLTELEELPRLQRRNNQYRGKPRTFQPNNRSIGATNRELTRHIWSLIPDAPGARPEVTQQGLRAATSSLESRISDYIPDIPLSLIVEEHEDRTISVYSSAVSAFEDTLYETFDKTVNTTGDYMKAAAASLWLDLIYTHITGDMTEAQQFAWNLNIPKELIDLYALSLLPENWADNPERYLHNESVRLADQIAAKAWEWYNAEVHKYTAGALGEKGFTASDDAQWEAMIRSAQENSIDF